MKSSSSDNGYYPKFCGMASKITKYLKLFVLTKFYKNVVETVSEEDGKDYIKKAFRKTPTLKKKFM